MRQFSDKERKEILTYAEKHSVAEAAEVYGIRKNYVYRWRKEGEAVAKPKKARKAVGEVNLESLKLQLQERLKEVEKLQAIIAFLETGKL